MNKNIAMIVVGVLILLGGGAFLLAQNKSKSTVTPTPEVMQAQTTPEPTAMPSMTMEPSGSMEASITPSGTTGKKAVKEVTITGSNFKFDVPSITVKKGDVVTINFKNTEGFHDFVIDEFNVRTKIIPSGQTDTVQFTADKAGTFEFYCSVANHRQMGMKGSLIVQ